MFNKKIIIILSIAMALVLSTSVFGSISKYRNDKSQIKAAEVVKNPDGKEVKYSDIKYSANTEKKILPLDQIQGYISDEDLGKKGAKYSIKKVMTYEEAYNSGYEEAIRHDIDPNRLVWVLRSNFNKTHVINGSAVEKAIVTTIYDAETGEFLGISVKSDAPNGLGNLVNRHK